MSQQYTNLAASTLASNYTAGNTTITVATGDGALFPSTGDFTIGINDPPTFFLKCTSRSSDVLTVTTSGTEGSTATNQSTGAVVAQVITAAVLDGIRSDMMVMGTYANFLALSGTPKKGDKFKQTDGPYEWIYDGTVWQPFVLGQANSVDPVSSVYGQTTTLSASIISSDTSLTVTANFSAMPSAPFRIMIGTEQISVTAVSGTTWTISRGDGGTTAASHSSSATITQMYWFQKYWFSGCNFIDNQNGTHIVTTNNAGNQEYAYGLYQPLPNGGTGYTITMAMAPYFGVPWANYVSYGLAITDETHGATNMACAQFFDGTPIYSAGWSNWGGSGYAGGPSGATGYQPTIPGGYNVTAAFHPYTPWYVRVVDDGTLLNMYMSADGWQYYLTETIPRLTYMTTPSHFGMFLSGRNAWLSNMVLGCRVTVP